MKNNQHYFKISQIHKEDSFDPAYIFSEPHAQLSKYIVSTRKIKETLITLKTLIGDKKSKKMIGEYFKKLQSSLDRFSNCSEFVCFANACDNTLGNIQKDLPTLEKITRLYLQKRELNEVVPSEWVQAILDTNASRKKGSCGEEKLIKILEEFGFQRVNKWEDFDKLDRCVARFSGNFGIKKVRSNFGIKIKTKKQNKNLDLLIKSGKKIFLLEAKHLNTCGGGQDKQISELIEITSLKENKSDFYYIAFLDGEYSNVVLGSASNGDKLKTQRKEIGKYLSKNKNSFWLNTAGFKTLTSDLL